MPAAGALLFDRPSRRVIPGALDHFWPTVQEGVAVPNQTELTLILVKPDALKLSLTGYILLSFSEIHTGLRLAGAKIVHVSAMLAAEHYIEHRGKRFYDSLIDYISGRIHYPDHPEQRRVVALVYGGSEAVAKCRAVAGPTNPHVARERSPSTLRALGTVVQEPAAGRNGIERIDNLVHTSASPAEAEREIKLWFRPNDLTPANQIYANEVCDTHYYYRQGRLTTDYTPGDTCLLAPGDIAWVSDMESLRAIIAGDADADRLATVAAKYLINGGPA
jgi:nucleoside-diphosphate kinase